MTSSLLILLISITSLGIELENEKFEEAQTLNINLSGNNNGSKSLIDSVLKNDEIIDLVNKRDTHIIEKKLSEIKTIDNVNVYINSHFGLTIDVIEREPLVYSIFLDSYIDSKGIIFKNNNPINEVPNLLGSYDNKRINEVLNITKYLNEDQVFTQKLESIWFNEQDLFIKFKNSDLNIRLGDDKKIENKINKLKGFFLFSIEKLDNNNYKQIDLVYENQLVAIKK
jgi:cell division protein FtsQ